MTLMGFLFRIRWFAVGGFPATIVSFKLDWLGRFCDRQLVDGVCSHAIEGGRLVARQGGAALVLLVACARMPVALSLSVTRPPPFPKGKESACVTSALPGPGRRMSAVAEAVGLTRVRTISPCCCSLPPRLAESVTIRLATLGRSRLVSEMQQ